MRLSVAIPDSCLADESTREGKSRKISQAARACATAGAERVIVYKDGGPEADRRLMVAVLRYMEAPPFLRKKLFRVTGELGSAGVLAPLNIPSHAAPADPRKIREGDVREGVVARGRGPGGRGAADIGTGRAVPYVGGGRPGERVTLRMSGRHPGLSGTAIRREDAGAYWGYEAKGKGTLASLLSGWEGRALLTSRKGRRASAADLRWCAGHGGELLVAFGSTDRGIHDILGPAVRGLQDCRILNFYPGQATETVRLEEAMHGVLCAVRSGP